MCIDPFQYPGPRNECEAISFANAHGYEWAYLDTMRRAGRNPRHVPDGWPFAWLQYCRSRRRSMAIREAFDYWQENATLPGLS